MLTALKKKKSIGYKRKQFSYQKIGEMESCCGKWIGGRKDTYLYLYTNVPTFLFTHPHTYGPYRNGKSSIEGKTVFFPPIFPKVMLKGGSKRLNENE